ncbi:MAG: glycosyltransferase family 2 protein [bacterium]
MSLSGGKNQLQREAWVLIPAHNEEETIAQVVSQTARHVAQVWVVADGCADETAAAACSAGARVIELPRRRGKGAALKEAWKILLTFNEWSALILLDGDGQHDPSYLPSFLEVWGQTGAEVVLGRRTFDSMPLLRAITNRFMSFSLSALIQKKVADSQCGFRLLTREFIAEQPWLANHFEIESEIIFRAARRGWRIAEVPVPTIYQREKSKIRPFQDGCRWGACLMRHALRRAEVAR